MTLLARFFASTSRGAAGGIRHLGFAVLQAPLRTEDSSMHIRHALLVGAILAAAVPASAQTTFLRLSSPPKTSRSSAAFSPWELGRSGTNSSARLRDRSDSRATLASPLAPAYARDDSFATLPKPDESHSVFFSQSSLPVAAFGSGRLQLAGFGSTLFMENVELGPSGAGGLLDFRAPRHYQPGEPRSVESYGLSLAIHLGRNSQSAHPTEIWRSISRFIADAR